MSSSSNSSAAARRFLLTAIMGAVVLVAAIFYAFTRGEANIDASHNVSPTVDQRQMVRDRSADQERSPLNAVR